MADPTVTTAEEAAKEQAAGGCCEPDCGPTTCETSAEATGTAAETVVQLKEEETPRASSCGPSTCR